MCMPLRPRPLDPARLPGRATDIALTQAMKRPRRVALLVVIVLAIAAIPTLLILAIARLQGDRR
jgi:hypothetical protein